MTALMAHMIPYYPNKEVSLAVAQGIIDGGADYLEIQFPFSDPTADGPVIEAACTIALEQGFTVNQGFDFVQRVVSLANKKAKICIMTYASLVFKRGIENFCADAAASGAFGIIVPDLPVDSDEGLARAAMKNGLILIPVVVPTTTDKRLELITAEKPEYVYCALRTGITGSKTEIGPENRAFLDRVALGVRPHGGKLFGGFGIQEPGQVRALGEHVYGVVVGSAIVRIIQSNYQSEFNDLEGIQENIRTFVSSLILP